MKRIVARTLNGTAQLLLLEHHRIVESTEVQTTEEAPLLVPALIDLQVNGYGGVDFNAEDLGVDDVCEAVARLWTQGTGTFCATLVSAPEERLVRSLAVIAEARRRDARVAHTIAGIHVEGPYISGEDGPRGAHDPAFLRNPDLGEFDRWQRSCGGLVRIVTIAPECPGAIEYIASLTRQGVVCAIGHTAATDEQIHSAVAAGSRLSTHLGNGTHAVLPRHPNLIWSQLANDRLSASFIADGHHLPTDTFIAMFRAKGADASILVSDSVALAGMPAGKYTAPVGGEVTVEADGRICLTGTPYLAGSGASLLGCVNWAIGAAALPPKDAFRAATLNPGRMIGFERRTSMRISESDMLLISASEAGFVVQCTVIGGHVVFSA